MATIKDINKHFKLAESIALDLIEKRARKILIEHPNLKEFVMCMGSAQFTLHKPAYRERYGQVDSYDPVDSRFGDAPKYLAPVGIILDEWDTYLHLTGTPMRFTATGPKVTEW